MSVATQKIARISRARLNLLSRRLLFHVCNTPPVLPVPMCHRQLSMVAPSFDWSPIIFLWATAPSERSRWSRDHAYRMEFRWPAVVLTAALLAGNCFPYYTRCCEERRTIYKGTRYTACRSHGHTRLCSGAEPVAPGAPRYLTVRQSISCKETCSALLCADDSR